MRQYPSLVIDPEERIVRHLGLVSQPAVPTDAAGVHLTKITADEPEEGTREA